MLRTSKSIRNNRMAGYNSTADMPVPPPTIPQTDLLAWYKADSITGLADGDPVSTWPDLFGSNNLTQSSTQRPLFKTNILNGKPALLFDGSNDCMNAASNLTVGSSTVHIVCNFTGAGGYTCLLSAQKIAIYSALGDGEWGAYTSADLDSGVTLDTTHKYLRTIFNSASDVEMWTNGGSYVESSGGGSYQSRTATSIGAGNAAGTQSHAGYISEIIIYGAVQSSTDYAAVETYLNGEYGF